MKKLIIPIIAIVVLAACQSHQKESKRAESAKTKSVNQDDDSVKSKVNEHLTMATIYQQRSGEYRALCYQAFNLGKFMLDQDLIDKSVDKPRIVILDIDETVLDNSSYEARCILEGTSYPTYWDEWCNLASAKAVPGVADFLKYAKANGVDIFYVTNRKAYLEDVTLKNLRAAGLPDVEPENLLMRTTENSKELRRRQLAATYHISLLFGDNLSDFSDIFDNKSNDDRIAEVEKKATQFGKRFIVLPNAMYGDWETALYGKGEKLSDSARFILRRDALIGF